MVQPVLLDSYTVGGAEEFLLTSVITEKEEELHRLDKKKNRSQWPENNILCPH